MQSKVLPFKFHLCTSPYTTLTKDTGPGHMRKPMLNLRISLNIIRNLLKKVCFHLHQ